MDSKSSDPLPECRAARRIRDTFAPLAKEMFSLRQELLDSRRIDRIGEKADLSAESSVPFEVVEIGLRGLIEGLVLVPLLDEFELNLDPISHLCGTTEGHFPIEVKIQDFLYVVDDDGTMYTSTDNFPERLVKEAKRILVELGNQVYSVPHS